MKSSFQYTALAAILAVSVPSVASASFIGIFDVTKWTTTDNASGSVDLSNAPSSITLTSGDNQSFLLGDTDFIITAPNAGTVSFDWSYVTNDLFGYPLFDPFGYLVNGAFTILPDVNLQQGTTPQTGSNVKVQIKSGDVFGFRAETFDGYDGPSVTTISNFNFVPEPSSWALLGIGLVGLATQYRRQSARTTRRIMA